MKYKKGNLWVFMVFFCKGKFPVSSVGNPPDMGNPPDTIPKKNDLSNFPYIFVSFVFDFIYLCSKRVTVIYLLSFSL